jgi:hypothetical protein
MISLVYFGQKFYSQSGTILSSIYTNDFERYDYGFLQRDLENGYEVSIRQATPAERSVLENELAAIRRGK